MAEQKCKVFGHPRRWHSIYGCHPDCKMKCIVVFTAKDMFE